MQKEMESWDDNRMMIRFLIRSNYPKILGQVLIAIAVIILKVWTLRRRSKDVLMEWQTVQALVMVIGVYTVRSRTSVPIFRVNTAWCSSDRCDIDKSIVSDTCGQTLIAFKLGNNETRWNRAFWALLLLFAFLKTVGSTWEMMNGLQPGKCSVKYLILSLTILFHIDMRKRNTHSKTCTIIGCGSDNL